MLPSPPAEMDYHSTSKRKRSDIEAEESRDCSFRLQDLTTSSCHSFEPISKLLRAHLPLSWLASTNPNDPVPAGTLLQGPIKNITAWDYSVHIVRQLPNGGLLALEKADEDCFVAFPLQPFVTEKWIQGAAIGAAPAVNMQMMLHYTPVPEPSYVKTSRRTPSLSSDQFVKVPQNRKGMAARLSILSQNEKLESPVASPILQDIPAAPISTLEEQPNTEIVSSDVLNLPATQENADVTASKSVVESVSQPDMLSSAYLRQRYLDTLYMTKTSIAFYAKGALSRARARARVPNASMTLHDLAAFYRDSVLPPKKLGLKYSESLRNSIRDSLSDSNIDSPVLKKRSTRKTKLGKDGLWPTEAEYIARWWKDRDFASALHESQETELRNAINSLQFREMQMQIIIILETMAVESRQSNTPPTDFKTIKQSEVDDHNAKIESIENDPGSTHEPKKSAKKRNLETDLQHLVNKLCILHAVELGDIEFPIISSKLSEVEGTEGESKNRLRSFCIDVVIPFYASKLPSLCKDICKSLAGPDVVEQAKKAAHVHQNNVQPLPPGAAIKRQLPPRSNTLERTHSGSQLRQPSPPTLTRSSTLPPVPQFRRHPSETSQRPLSRQSSISFSNREVDLVADAKITASKKRKLDSAAAYQQDLAVAVALVKKPNRQVAGKAFMDEVDHRRADVKRLVQITATPRVNRRKTLNDLGEDSDTFKSSLDEAMVPSSGVRSRTASALLSAPTSSNRKRAVLAAISDTPSRGATKKSNPLQLSNNTNTIPAPKGVRGQGNVSTSSALVKPGLFATSFSTPTRPGKTSEGQENSFQLSTLAMRTMDRAMNMPVGDSIYDQLGWNDDDEM